MPLKARIKAWFDQHYYSMGKYEVAQSMSGILLILTLMLGTMSLGAELRPYFGRTATLALVLTVCYLGWKEIWSTHITPLQPLLPPRRLRHAAPELFAFLRR